MNDCINYCIWFDIWDNMKYITSAKHLEIVMNYEEIEQWLIQHNIKKYTITDELIVDVAGDVDLFGQGLKEIPVRFGKVNGCFDISCNKLTSLRGSPHVVFEFNCSNNKLTTLLYGPIIVIRYYVCYHNNLSSLLGAPKRVGGCFDCSYNNLTTLNHFPEYIAYTTTVDRNKLQVTEETEQAWIAAIKNSSLVYQYIREPNTQLTSLHKFLYEI